MRPEDWAQLEVSLPEIARATGPAKGLLLCTPAAGETEMWSGAYPGSSVTEWALNEWDIREPCPRRFDLIVATNVFLCAADPALWFRNCFAACRHLVIQDVCRGFRGGGGRELPLPGSQGSQPPEVMRYSLHPEMVALLPTAYDLNAHRDRLVHHAAYPNGPNGINFIAAFRGDL
jgi:hypothetical protein